ncbi:MAG: IclR family transcriptional regulator [Solirubrobacteraceae bacterium]
MSKAQQSGGGDDTSREKKAVPPLIRRSQSLEIGLAIPLLFSGERREIGVYELADLIGFSHATAHRYARTYVHLGVLEQHGSHKYQLAPSAADPGLSVIGAMRRAMPVLSVLEELRDATGYTVSLGVLNGTQVTYIHRVYAHCQGQYQVDQDMCAGTHIPIHCTALGKALLASLTDMARRRIIANVELIPYGPNSIMEPIDLISDLESLDHRKPIVSDEEFLPGARSIAMYVPRSQDGPRIAIDVTVPAEALTVNQLSRQVGPSLRSAVKLISQVTGK